MTLKSLLARSVHGIERAIDRIRPGTRPDGVVIDPYIGYATPEHIVLRGRVLAALRHNNPDATASKLANLRQMVGLFLTDEVAEVPVRAGDVEGRSDEEGYFTLMLPRDDAPTGWFETQVEVEGGVPSTLKALIARPDAPFAVISDIDDTVLETGAYSLMRNLWTSLTGNALTRKIFPDAIDLLKDANASGVPIYFVSSSPWNMHQFLRSIFRRTGVPEGPLFLRDLGISDKQFISGTHGDHKGASIDILMAANPGLDVVLIGDTGQHDPEVYLAAAKRHPGRVRRVILREPGQGADATDISLIGKIEALGVPVSHAADFRGMTL